MLTSQHNFSQCPFVDIRIQIHLNVHNEYQQKLLLPHFILKPTLYQPHTQGGVILLHVLLFGILLQHLYFVIILCNNIYSLVFVQCCQNICFAYIISCKCNCSILQVCKTIFNKLLNLIGASF